MGKHGGLDILVNNAGIQRSGAASVTTRESWDDIMAVNLWGTFLGCKFANPGRFWRPWEPLMLSSR
jgi:NAD(P)-dependent dehydrogenase (short-subunit alcohol dehydrogenase family)